MSEPSNSTAARHDDAAKGWTAAQVVLMLASAALLGTFAGWASQSGRGDTNSQYFAFVVPGYVLFGSGLVYAAVAVIRQSFWPVAAIALMAALFNGLC